MKRYPIAFALLLLAWFAAGSWPAAAAAAADDNDAVKLVMTGRIEKVDTKHQTFQFKFDLDQTGRGAVRPQPYPGRPGGIGGRRGRIGGYPGRRPYPNQVPDTTMEVKVFVSEATRLKSPSAALQFTDLKAGDLVTITATHHAKSGDLDAQVVARN